MATPKSFSVYLDADGVVIGRAAEHLARTTKTLADFQSENDANAVGKIEGGPVGITYKSPVKLTFHKKTSGDGTDISHYTLVTNLDVYKKERNEVIDARSDGIYAAGFTYATKVFSLSASAQSNWISLGVDISLALLVEPSSFPIPVATINNDDTYEIVDIADATAFHQAFRDAMMTVRSLGATHKKAVGDASSTTEVDAVKDNR